MHSFFTGKLRSRFDTIAPSLCDRNALKHLILNLLRLNRTLSSRMKLEFIIFVWMRPVSKYISEIFSLQFRRPTSKLKKPILLFWFVSKFICKKVHQCFLKKNYSAWGKFGKGEIPNFEALHMLKHVGWIGLRSRPTLISTSQITFFLNLPCWEIIHEFGRSCNFDVAEGIYE